MRAIRTSHGCGLGQLPDAIERRQVVPEEATTWELAQMQHGRLRRGRPVGVGVDEHVVVEAIEGVVERRVVEAHPDLRRLDRWPEIDQAELDAPGHAVADGLL